MAVLPPRPDLDQLRRQAEDLLTAARDGDPDAVDAVRGASRSGGVTLAAAQTALAHAYGFGSWAALRREVVRRSILDHQDTAALAAALADDPALATEAMRQWGDHPGRPGPLSYVAMLRYDTARGVWRDVTGTAEMARALIAAGAPVNGADDDPETPLITAASYGDADVARVLIEAGADLERRAAPTSGGVPGGTALQHAAVFGMTAVVDVLVAAGARADDLAVAAAAGDLTGRDVAAAPETDRLLALIMAADHERLDVIDALLDAGTPIDAVDPVWGRQALRLARQNGRDAAVAHLLARGARG